jgi:hypothetical protein
MAFIDRLNTTNIYRALTIDPVQILKRNELSVHHILGLDTAVMQLAFCYDPGFILILPNGPMAAAMIAQNNLDTVIYRRMVATPMRGHGLPNRKAATAQQGTAPINPAGVDLWVTNLQTGCTVLILDWGGNNYSMVHLQPYTDNQYNAIGRSLLGWMSNWTFGYNCLYQIFWLKRDATQTTNNTGNAPQRYIMVESMHAASTNRISQVIGVCNGDNWRFFLQRTLHGHLELEVQELRWTNYNNYTPYFSY